MGRRPSAVSCAPWRGFRERPGFGAPFLLEPHSQPLSVRVRVKPREVMVTSQVFEQFAAQHSVIGDRPMTNGIGHKKPKPASARKKNELQGAKRDTKRDAKVIKEA